MFYRNGLTVSWETVVKTIPSLAISDEIAMAASSELIYGCNNYWNIEISTLHSLWQDLAVERVMAQGSTAAIIRRSKLLAVSKQNCHGLPLFFLV